MESVQMHFILKVLRTVENRFFVKLRLLSNSFSVMSRPWRSPFQFGCTVYVGKLERSYSTLIKLRRSRMLVDKRIPLVPKFSLDFCI